MLCMVANAAIPQDGFSPFRRLTNQAILAKLQQLGLLIYIKPENQLSETQIKLCILQIQDWYKKWGINIVSSRQICRIVNDVLLNLISLYDKLRLRGIDSVDTMKQNSIEFLQLVLRFEAEAKQWERGDREIYEQFLQGKNVDIVGVWKRQAQNDERRIAKAIATVKMPTPKPKLQETTILKSGRVSVKRARYDSSEEDEEKAADDYVPEPDLIAENSKPRKTPIPYGTDFTPLLAKRIQTKVSFNGLTEIIATYAEITQLGPECVPSKTTLFNNETRAIEKVKTKRLELIENLKLLEKPCFLHFDGAMKFECALIVYSGANNEKVKVSLAAESFYDHVNAEEVTDWLVEELEEVGIVSDVLVAVGDTTTLVSGWDADENKGGVMKKLLERLENLQCFMILCESHSNQLRIANFITAFSEEKFGAVSNESNASATAQSYRILCHNLSDIHQFDEKRLWDGIDSTKKYRLPRYVKPMQKYQIGKLKSLHKLLYDILTDKEISGDIISKSFPKQGVRWFGFLTATVTCFTIKDDLIINMNKIVDATRCKKIHALIRNTIAILDCITENDVKDMIQLGKTAFSCFYHTVNTPFYECHSSTCKITKEFSELIPKLKTLSTEGLEKLKEQHTDTCNRQLYKLV